MQQRVTSTIIGCAMVAGTALADPPAGYYNNILDASGVPQRNQLTALLNIATTRNYGDARDLLQIIDEDPANPDNIILVYDGASIDSTWTSGATWNREHTWPRSLGVGSSGSDNSDLHMLRPCNPGINSLRGNQPFGTQPGRWDPDRYGQAFRGEMARVVFYANTRYTYLGIPVIGSQAEFIDWHYDQMPDTDDQRRNDRVFDTQANRNPFVDHPEWVWALFGTGPSDAQVSIQGQSPSNGATSTTIDLGRSIGPASTLQTSVILTKTGAAPTSVRITAAGDITSPLASDQQTGFARQNQSLSIPVTLQANPGTSTGTLTIDNTEPTSASAGTGANDGDDLITITATRLMPAIASFDQQLTSNVTTLDLGNIVIGDPSGPFDVPIWNRANATTGASLDVDSVTIVSGPPGTQITGAPALSIAPGDSTTLGLTLNPTSEGSVSALALITVSDEDVPGATSRQLTLNITANAISECLADVNQDGALNGLDFGAWLGAFNANAPIADQNQDGMLNGLDFGAWLGNYNAGCN